jgi:RAP domain
MRVAVEFDGPNHFTRVTNAVSSGHPGASRAAPRTLGHTVLKYRLLKKQGWTVVRVPFYEFDRIPFWASMERQRYLQRLLKTHADIRFSAVDVSEYRPIVTNRRSRFD